MALAAGCCGGGGGVVAVLTEATDAPAEMPGAVRYKVTIDEAVAVPFTIDCKPGSFVAAKRQASFAGASSAGQLVLINCASSTSAAIYKDVAGAIGAGVKKVVAMIGQQVIFVCTKNRVWHCDAAIAVSQSPPAQLQMLGNASKSDGHVVGCFASPTKAAFVFMHDATPSAAATLFSGTIIDLAPGSSSAPGSRDLSAPAFAACCTGEYTAEQTVCLFVGGSRVVAMIIDEGGAASCKAKVIFTSKSSAVRNIAVAQDGLVCLLENKRVVRINKPSPGSGSGSGSGSGAPKAVLLAVAATALTDSGDVMEPTYQPGGGGRALPLPHRRGKGKEDAAPAWELL